MQAKELCFGDEARNKILTGISKLNMAVASTLGPRGRNVIIRNEYGDPYLTKDGVSVAKQVKLSDALEDAGAQLVVKVAEKTVEKAGDGTTSSVILAHAIFKEGVKFLTAGADGMSLRRGIEKGLEVALEKIQKEAIPVESKEQIRDVALVSANGDAQVADLIADGMWEVGPDGIVVVSESKTAKTFLDIVQGLGIEEGYVTPQFVNVPNSKKCILENAYILMTDRKVVDAKQIITALKMANKDQKALLVVAENCEGEALVTLIVNVAKKSVNACAVRAPGYGGAMKDALDDMAALVGGKVISESAGMTLGVITENNYLDYLGFAEKVEITDKGTTIINNRQPELTQNRILFLKSLLEAETDVEKQQQLRKRIAKLSGGIAVIKVGATTTVELREKMDRIDDAVHATKVAREEGIVPGAGWTMLDASRYMAAKKWDQSLTEDEAIGYSILCKALEAPLRTLALNSGVEAGEAIRNTQTHEVEYKKKLGVLGYDFRQCLVCDLIEKGIIDPVVVAKSALSNAASIAGLLLTSNCMIIEKSKAEQLNHTSMQDILAQSVLNGK